MNTMRVLFCHGLESGPWGRKSQAIRDAGWDVVSPDCAGITDVEERIRKTSSVVRSIMGPWLVVGSSFGGVVANAVMQRESIDVVGAVFCAPAFGKDYAEPYLVAPPCPFTILHGTNDDIIPPQASVDFVRRFGGSAVIVQDAHGLVESIPTLLRLIRQLADRADRVVGY